MMEQFASNLLEYFVLIPAGILCYLPMRKQIRYSLRSLLITAASLFLVFSSFGSLAKLYFSFDPNIILFPILYTKNNALNAILNFYATEAKNEEIDVSFSIDIDKWQMLSDVELCTITGNLLENAIDAAKNAEDKERFIELTMTTRGGCWLYIVETNGFDGNIKMKSGEYYSSKRNGRGLGIASIKSTVEKYGGKTEFSHQGHEFYVNIAIPLNEE